MKLDRKKIWLLLLCLMGLSMGLTGCVDYSKKRETKENTTVESTKNTTDHKKTERNTSKKSLRIVATSMATVTICEKLGIPLVGVPESQLEKVPDCYKDATKIGSPMAPDMETISSLKPDWILSPVSLMSDLKPKYETIGVKYAFLNLSSIQGMYRSVEQLGTLFDCETEADKMVEEFKEFYTAFQKGTQGKKKPKVLILMGLPGSYVVATEASYVGNLVALAGGDNVYGQEKQDFINVNTEDMLKKDPDIILRTSHALPDQVKKMFAEEFKKDTVWKNFRAVKTGKVYDLENTMYGMSANFNYQKGLLKLQTLLYGKEK